jgi:hypothetical protein
MAADETTFSAIEHALKRSAAALRRADVPFLLGGSLASWARGGPETTHDLDLMIKPEDAERALEALTELGFRAEKPPEGWLYKAWDGDVLVDLIFEPAGMRVDDRLFRRATELEVNAVRIPVAAPKDVLVSKLLALREHELDYDQLLEMARTVREQIDWDDVRLRTAHSPFAKAFFTLVDELGVSS